MNNLQILQAVKEQNSPTFAALMNHFKHHPDRAPVADMEQIATLITAGYLRGETKSYTAIHITPLGEVYLQDLQEEENRRLAKEKYENETLKAMQDQVDRLQKQNDELAELNESTKQMAIDSRTQANIAEAKAKKANVKGTIATVVSVIALLIDIIVNYREIVEFFKSVMPWF